MERLYISPLPLPLSTNGPPAGHGWEGEEREMSLSSATSEFEFDTRIERRDTFLGQPCCVVCGDPSDPMIEHCRLIGDSELEFVS